MRFRTTHLAPLVLVVLGILLGGLSARSVDDRAQEELEVRLRADANELGLLLQGLASSFDSELSALSAIALVVEDPATGHTDYVTTNQLSTPHVLLDLSDGDPRILNVASATGDPSELTEARGGVESALESPAVRGQLRQLGRDGGFSFLLVPGEDALVMAGAARSGRRAYVDVVYFQIGFTGQMLATQVGDISDFALYAGEDPDPAAVVISSTADVPLTGHVAAETVEVGDRPVRIEVSGSLEHALPPHVVWGGWIAVMSVIAAVLWLALRRRDAAVISQQAAERAEGRFRAVLDGSPDTVLLWQAEDGALTVLNRDHLFGHPVAELATSADFADLVHPDDRHLMRGLGAQLDGSEASDGIDLRVVTADDEVAWARLRLSRLPTTDRRDDADTDVLAVVTETTAMHEAERHRQRMEAELQQAQRIESVGQLAGGIAHDFNNLLAAISSTAELIAADVDDARTKRDIDEIMDATRRGASLTRRLLTFSKRSATPHGPVDINTVIGDLATLLRRAVGESVDLWLSLSDEPLTVLGDPGEVEQVVTNLVINARDAATGPGHRIRVATRRSGDRAVIEVVDNGAGMSDEVQARAFEPFFSTKSVDKGTGLGLSIVYGIVGRMGGSVDISSREGSGAVVTIELDLVPAAPAGHDVEHPVDADTAPTPLSRESIARPVGEMVLLVEDEPAVRRAASRLVERAGHTVRAAGDGHEALDAVRNGFIPTVLLTDVVLPGTLTGRDVAQQVRELVPEVRVIYASGYSRDLIDADQLEAERALFLAKPFTSQTLLDAIGTPVRSPGW